MDIEKELGRVLTSGKLCVGTKEAMRTKEAKMFIISNNCPTKKEVMKTAGESIPVYIYSGNNVALGTACGKPFSISVVSIIDEGKSNILKLGKMK